VTTSTGRPTRPDRRIRRREIALALLVLVPLWTLGVSLRDEVAVLLVSLLAAVAMGVAATILQVRHHVRPQVGHDVWIALPAAAAHLAVSYVAIPVAEAVVPLIGEQAEGLVLDARGGLPTIVVALVAALVIAPLEELFWRGSVQPSLGVGRTPTEAILLTTAAFAGFHLPTLQLPLISAAALGGLVWGWLRERTDGLAAPVVAHAIWTGAMVLVPPT
jgi:membrane protease YdiL (CAAX protease family)